LELEGLVQPKEGNTHISLGSVVIVRVRVDDQLFFPGNIVFYFLKLAAQSKFIITITRELTRSIRGKENGGSCPPWVF